MAKLADGLGEVDSSHDLVNRHGRATRRVAHPNLGAWDRQPAACWAADAEEQFPVFCRGPWRVLRRRSPVFKVSSGGRIHGTGFVAKAIVEFEHIARINALEFLPVA